ncbi:MAG TPA: methyltransferase [Bryobacteraceae bacterium]|jgi:protein-S-isoprenylcysteine O-methyltransferase Ste14
MLWVRGIVFTILVPFMAGIEIPRGMLNGARPATGWWQAGWLLFGVGVLLYGWCLVLFLLSGGTPNIFFARHLGFLIGTEPGQVVRRGPYRFSRNPMYVAVLSVILAQACVYRSRAVMTYWLSAWCVFHLVVVLLEEPHLRRVRPDYEQYFRTVPRYLG